MTIDAYLQMDSIKGESAELDHVGWIEAAKEIFDSIYPDEKVTCSGEKGERLRRKQNLWCAYIPSQGYRCFFGFNLRTGESIPGGSC